MAKGFPLNVLACMPGGSYPAYAAAQVRELIERYRPDVLWNDISWPQPERELRYLIAHYYNQVPDGVINDRWLARSWLIPWLRVGWVNRVAERLLKAHLRRRGGTLVPPVPPVYDYRTPEYASFDAAQAGKWECVRGMDKSFGYNRASLPEDFISRSELIHSFVDIVSKNGNLLLNVGPRGVDAQIPEIQLERLAWLGEFLRHNGEAVYGTRPWAGASASAGEGDRVRFTEKDGTVHRFTLGDTTRAEVHADA